MIMATGIEFSNFIKEITLDFQKFSEGDKPAWHHIKEGNNKGCYELKYVNELKQQVEILYNPISKKLNIIRDWPSKTTFEVDFEKDTITMKIMDSQTEIGFEETISPKNAATNKACTYILQEYDKFDKLIANSIMLDPNYKNIGVNPSLLTPEMKEEVEKIRKLLDMAIESSHTIIDIATAVVNEPDKQMTR